MRLPFPKKDNTIDERMDRWDAQFGIKQYFGASLKEVVDPTGAGRDYNTVAAELQALIKTHVTLFYDAPKPKKGRDWAPELLKLVDFAAISTVTPQQMLDEYSPDD